MVGVGNAKLYGIQGHATLEDCQDGTHLFVNAGDEGGGEVPNVVRSKARVGLVLVEGGVGTTFGERGVLDDGAVQVDVAVALGSVQGVLVVLVSPASAAMLCAVRRCATGLSGTHVVWVGGARHWLFYPTRSSTLSFNPGKGVTCFYLTKTQHLVS